MHFSAYHPVVNILYYVMVIGLSMFLMHPAALAVSLLLASSYSLVLQGVKAFKGTLLLVVPLMLVTALINPIINHQGFTILCYLPSGNPITLEAVMYGVCSSLMLGSVICHFSTFNRIMTSDKLGYLFGRVTPSLSLVFSMVLTFVPEFKTQLAAVSNAQKCIGNNETDGKLLQKAQYGIKILSVMLTWSLENAIETSDSMKCRGYGLENKTFYSNYTFSKRDIYTVAFIASLSAYVLLGAFFGAFECNYFPMLKLAQINVYNVSVYVSFGLLVACPIILQIWEAAKWNYLISKS